MSTQPKIKKDDAKRKFLERTHNKNYHSLDHKKLNFVDIELTPVYAARPGSGGLNGGAIQ